MSGLRVLGGGMMCCSPKLICMTGKGCVEGDVVMLMRSVVFLFPRVDVHDRFGLY